MKQVNEQAFTFPSKFEYVRGALGDATWLIISRIEDEEAQRNALLIPRKIMLEIDLMPAQNLLPILIKETIFIGEAYSSNNMTVYRGKPYSMGTPRMYLEDPTEYWRKFASTHYLTNVK